MGIGSGYLAFVARSSKYSAGLGGESVGKRSACPISNKQSIISSAWLVKSCMREASRCVEFGQEVWLKVHCIAFS